MSRLYKFSLLLLMILTLSSCTTQLDTYKKSSPTLDIKKYFTGKVIAWGMVQDYTDNVTRRFCVEIDGQWQGSNGVLKEVFYFADGEITYRNWQLKKLAQGKYQGSAEDVIGTAIGQQVGFAFQWQYDLLVPIDGDEIQFSLDDWMYQIDEHRIFNRTKMKKLGVTLAEITLFFDKQTPVNSCR